MTEKMILSRGIRGRRDSQAPTRLIDGRTLRYAKRSCESEIARGGDPSERASFEAYRLNRLVDVRSEVLVSLADWKAVEARPVPDRAGRPILALDLGSTRSWSAAWVLWPSGRSELCMRWLRGFLRLPKSRSATVTEGHLPADSKTRAC